MIKKLTKDDVQDEAVEISKQTDKILLKHGTGLGKSLSFIRIQEYHKPKSVYIIVSEKNHIQNWINEYKKHGKEELLKVVTFFCYASIHKYMDTKVDMLCMDEGHHVTSEARLDSLSTIKANKIILLSATIKPNQVEAIESVVGEFYKYTVGLKLAIEEDIIPTPIVYLIPLELNNINSETIEFTRGNSKLREKIYCEFKDRFKYIRNKKLYPNIDLIIQCSQFQKNSYLDDMNVYYKRQFFVSRSLIFKNKWLQNGMERKRYLARIKTSLVQTLLNKVKHKRFICFCGSIDQARILSDNKNLLCSEEKNTDITIDKFNNGDISNLFVINMLQEGANLSDIEVGIIVQLDGDVGPFIQKSGRIMRSKQPIIYVFYYKDTRDEEYLQNIYKEIDSENIRVIENLEQYQLN